jgi:hypothetical protein
MIFRANHTGVEQAHAYHHQEVLGPDKVVARTILLDGGKNFKPRWRGSQSARRLLIPCLRLKSKSVAPRKRDSRPEARGDEQRGGPEETVIIGSLESKRVDRISKDSR